MNINTGTFYPSVRASNHSEGHNIPPEKLGRILGSESYNFRCAGDNYYYVTDNDGLMGLVEVVQDEGHKNGYKEVMPTIYEKIVAKVIKHEGREKSENSASGITLAVKDGVVSYFDSYDGFKKIDTTGYETTSTVNRFGYTLYKTDKLGRKKAYYLTRRKGKIEKIEEKNINRYLV